MSPATTNREYPDQLEPHARAWPQGTCPKPWVAIFDGNPLFDNRGGLRRFSTEAAALKAARQAAEAA